MVEEEGRRSEGEGEREGSSENKTEKDKRSREYEDLRKTWHESRRKESGYDPTIRIGERRMKKSSRQEGEIGNRGERAG